MEWLKEKGAGVNARDARGRTPMFEAVEKVFRDASLEWFYRFSVEDSLRCLRRLGADVNAKDREGRALTHLAAREGKIYLLTALRGMGADLHARNNAGQTPRDVAQAGNQGDTAIWLECLAAENEGAIDARKFAEIKNVEIRREFVRIAGIERIVQAMGAEALDSDGDYELLRVDLLGRTGKVPYLKMINPSMGVWHLEAVPKEIATVKAALVWRNQSGLVPEQLT